MVTPVERLEVVAVDGGDGQPAQAAGGADEVLDELVGGMGEQLGGRAELRQPPAGGEDRHPVAHLDRLVDVVGDEDDGLAELALEPQELLLEPDADHRVDRAERLVHQQHRRVGRERPGHADALALTAGELVGIAVAVGRRVEADEVHQLAGALLGGRRRLAVEQRHRHHVAQDLLVGEQPDLLDDVADAAAQLDRVDGGDVLAVDEDAPGGRLDQPVDHLQRRRLAAARRSHQHHELAARDVEVELVDGDGAVVVGLADAGQPDHRRLVRRRRGLCAGLSHRRRASPSA